MPEGKGKVSLKDIAREVGVSAALVSYVLNNRFENRIRKNVAEKIRKTAERLNYRPNQIAKSLKTSKTHTIGLIVADISNPFSSTLARIIEDEGARYDYTVFFGSSDEDLSKFEKLTRTFLDRQVDGLILLPPEGAEKQIMQLQKANFPFVIVDRYFEGINAHYVNVDNFGASYNAVELFIKRGKQKIGLINYQTALQHLNDRTGGYRKALEDAGIPFNPNQVKKVGMNNEGGEITAAVKELLDSGTDAILFASNRIAVQSLQYIRQQNIQVPEIVELIGFDETEVFDFFQPQVSYIKQPLQQMGQAATQLLMDVIGERNDIPNIFIPARLVQRGSTSSPAG